MPGKTSQSIGDEVRPASLCRQSPRTLALMCLEGKIEPLSRQMPEPIELLIGPTMAYGYWEKYMNLSVEVESRIEFRDRKLTAAEKRMALPWEINMARQPGQLRHWKQVWAQRVWLAKRRKPARRIQTQAPPPMVKHKNRPRLWQEKYFDCPCKEVTSKQCRQCNGATVRKAVAENKI